jgi:hypothetical protein
MTRPENLNPAPEELHNALLFAAGVYLGAISTDARSHSLLLHPAQVPTFIATRLPVLASPIPPAEHLLATEDNRERQERQPDFSLVGKVSLQQVQPLTDSDQRPVQHFWAVEYQIDTVQWLPVTRQVVGERQKLQEQLVAARTPLTNVDRVNQAFPPELAVSEAEQLIYLLEHPRPLFGYDPPTPRSPIQ